MTKPIDEAFEDYVARLARGIDPAAFKSGRVYRGDKTERQRQALDTALRIAKQFPPGWRRKPATPTPEER